jgi:hypothetical protein
MAIYGTPANKAAASRLYSKLFLSNLDLDDGGGKGFSTYNTAYKPNIIKMHIFSTLVAYTKV